jgi:hypothetical protein
MVFRDLFTGNTALAVQLESASTVSYTWTAQPVQETITLDTPSQTLPVSVTVRATPGSVDSFSVLLNGSVVNTLAGDGASPHPTAVQVELDGFSIQHTGVSTIASGVSEHGVAFAVFGLPSSSMPPLTLAIAAATTNDGQTGIAVVVSGGNFFNAGVIWLGAPPSDAPVPEPSQTGSFSRSFFVASTDSKTFQPDSATDEQPAIGPSALEAATRRPALFVSILPIGELLRRTSTAAAYVGWSGRDNPALTLEPTAGAKSATPPRTGTNAAAVAVGHVPHLLRHETEDPVDPQVIGATFGLAWDPEWLVEADPRRQILPEDEPLNAPPSPQARRVKARASARSLALLAIGITATWIYGHGTSDVAQPRNQGRPRCRG